MRRLADISASRRRATKIARLIETAPPLEVEQVRYLCALLKHRAADGGAQ